jgi:hypothetical protein
MPLDRNEIGYFLLPRRYATSCTLKMTLKAAALVIVVASGAVKFRMPHVGSLGRGNMALGLILVGSTAAALHGMVRIGEAPERLTTWRGHLVLGVDHFAIKRSRRNCSGNGQRCGLESVKSSE